VLDLSLLALFLQQARSVLGIRIHPHWESHQLLFFENYLVGIEKVTIICCLNYLTL